MRTKPRRMGLLGGISWQSSIGYERKINEETNRRLGGNSSGDLIVRSYDFAQIEASQVAGDWDFLAETLATDAACLEAAGAECVLICANTMHLVAPQVEAAIGIPLLHIGDATAAGCRSAGVSKALLLGTRYTMTQPFLIDRLTAVGIEIVVPDADDRTTVHDVVYDELVKGIVNPASKQAYLDVIDRSLAAGATGVISGCTEIEMLLSPDDLSVPMLPTAELHAMAAVDWSLS